MADEKHIATAAELRAKPILVDVPGTTIQIACKRPDPIALFEMGLLPLDRFHAVLEKLSTGASLREVVVDNVSTKTMSELIDRWACAAAVEPKLVMTAKEADDQSVWVEDLEPSVRYHIWQTTNDRLGTRRVSDHLAEFREQESLRALAGSDGAAVRDAAEPSAVAV